jgi:hypothetical protein
VERHLDGGAFDSSRVLTAQGWVDRPGKRRRCRGVPAVLYLISRPDSQGSMARSHTRGMVASTRNPGFFFARRVCPSASWRVGGADLDGRLRSWPDKLVGREWPNAAAGVGLRRAEGSLGGPRWPSPGQVPSPSLASHIALQRERGQGVCRLPWPLVRQTDKARIHVAWLLHQAPEVSGQVSNRGIIAPPLP